MGVRSRPFAKISLSHVLFLNTSASWPNKPVCNYLLYWPLYYEVEPWQPGYYHITLCSSPASEAHWCALSSFVLGLPGIVIILRIYNVMICIPLRASVPTPRTSSYGDAIKTPSESSCYCCQFAGAPKRYDAGQSRHKKQPDAEGTSSELLMQINLMQEALMQIGSLSDI